MSETLQYTVVGIILLAVCVWVVIKVTGVLRGKSTGCDCCALSKTCTTKGKLKSGGKHPWSHTPASNPAADAGCDACKAARN